MNPSINPSLHALLQFMLRIQVHNGEWEGRREVVKRGVCMQT